MDLKMRKYGMIPIMLMMLLPPAPAGVAAAMPIMRSPIVAHQQQPKSAALSNSSSTDCADAISDSLPITRIYADVLIPGRGPPVTPGLVVIQGDTIKFAGSPGSAFAPPPEAPGGTSETVVEVPVVMPGMWDCHTHFMGQTSPGKVLVQGYSPEKYMKFASALKQAKEALHAGVTSIRELGGIFSQALHRLIENGDAEGPNYHYAGQCIGMTGGHTDEHDLPLHVVNSREYESFGTLCDGVPSCLKAVREQLRRQADVIKVMTSGGVLSLYDQVTDDQFTHEEISAMVQEAARAKRVVAAHAHSHGGIQSAIDAGIYTIEHGSYMTDDQAVQIREKGMVYIPTCTVTQVFNSTEKPPEIADISWKKGQAIVRAHHKAVVTAIKNGVTILAGTDCPNGCAEVGKEVGFLNQLYGMPVLQAIEAATANGPLCLGKLGMAPLSGQLKRGYEADVIALSSSPLEDITVLQDADKVTHVWKSGKLFKSPPKQCEQVETS